MNDSMVLYHNYTLCINVLTTLIHYCFSQAFQVNLVLLYMAARWGFDTDWLCYRWNPHKGCPAAEFTMAMCCLESRTDGTKWAVGKLIICMQSEHDCLFFCIPLVEGIPWHYVVPIYLLTNLKPNRPTFPADIQRRM